MATYKERLDQRFAELGEAGQFTGVIIVYKTPYEKQVGTMQVGEESVELDQWRIRAFILLIGPTGIVVVPYPENRANFDHLKGIWHKDSKLSEMMGEFNESISSMNGGPYQKASLPFLRFTIDRLEEGSVEKELWQLSQVAMTPGRQDVNKEHQVEIMGRMSDLVGQVYERRMGQMNNMINDGIPF